MLAIKNPQLLNQTLSRYNPDTGEAVTLVWEGTEAQMTATRAFYIQGGSEAPIGYGLKCELSRKAGETTRLTVNFPDAILFTDRWDLDTEMHPQPIWKITAVRDLLAPGLTVVADIDKRVGSSRMDILALIDVKLANDAITPIPAALDPFQSRYGAVVAKWTDPLNGGSAALAANVIKVYRIVLRDGEYADVHQPVLTRRRTIPVWNGEFTGPDGSTAQRVRIVGRQEIYTTVSLIDTFNLPDEVIAQIETVENGLPDAPADYVWAWKLRKMCSSTLVGSGKAEESTDWIFDLYSEITHELVT